MDSSFFLALFFACVTLFVTSIITQHQAVRAYNRHARRTGLAAIQRPDPFSFADIMISTAELIHLDTGDLPFRVKVWVIAFRWSIGLSAIAFPAMLLSLHTVVP